MVSIGADEVLFPPPVVDVGVEEAVTAGRAAAADATRRRTVNVSAERRFLSTWLSDELPEIEDPYKVLGTPEREVR